MQLLIISGFLGSGKTSILMPFVKNLTEKSKKVAIIENEIGEKGVDDLFLRENGLHVKEIYHGCICCNLRSDLIGSLLELERDFKPEIVVMEPTGVADPNLILSSLSGYPGDLETITMLSIVDAERFKDILEMKNSLVIDGIQSADLIALNKIDLVSADDCEKIISEIKILNQATQILKVSCYDVQLLEELFKAIEAKLFSIEIKEREKRIVLEKKGIPPTVCSKNFQFSENEICLSERETKKYFEDRIYRIALLLEEAGADLIGNLKLIIRSDHDGYLLISTTSFSRYPEVKGKLPAGYTTIKFNMNAMVYGIEKENLNSIINQVFPHY